MTASASHHDRLRALAPLVGGIAYLETRTAADGPAALERPLAATR